MASAYLDQWVAISGRYGRPGVYVCFVDESRKQLLLWRVGTNDAISVASSPSIIEKPLLVPGPGGELWLAWLEGNQVLVRTLAADGHSSSAVRAFALPKTPYFLDPPGRADRRESGGVLRGLADAVMPAAWVLLG